MNREQFEHTVRAAGAVLGISELLVIGSQALHASMSGALPDEASRSVEVDVAVFEDAEGRGADVIDGSIGEASMFHATLDTTRTVSLKPPQCCQPVGASASSAFRRQRRAVWWRGVSSPTTCGVSKAIAGREKDLEFCSALVSLDVVERRELTQRLAQVGSLDPRLRTLVQARIDR